MRRRGEGSKGCMLQKGNGEERGRRGELCSQQDGNIFSLASESEIIINDEASYSKNEHRQMLSKDPFFSCRFLSNDEHPVCLQTHKL